MIRDISRRRLLGVLTGSGLVAGVVGGGPSAAARTRRTQDLVPPAGSVTETDPALLSLVESVSLLRAGALHPRDLLDACLRRSEEFDGAVGAWIRTYPDIASAAADDAARRLSDAGRRAGGEPPALCGVPIALKDLVAVKGLPLTASSRVLQGNIAAGDAHVWRRLRDAGAVLMGHVHTDEFAIGVATPQVGNPWNLDFSPGGSSGGSGAALAARFVPAALGTDTGGSLRIPASACGVSAIKPTFGRTSAAGVVPLVWSRDHVGPMGRSVADAALLLAAFLDDHPAGLVGGVARGGTTEIAPARGASSPLAGVRLGLVEAETPGGDTGRLFADAVAVLRGLGADCVPVTLPDLPRSLAMGDVVEMGAFHNQFLDRIGLYEPEHAQTILAANAAVATPVLDYIAMERDRLRYQFDYNRMFEDHGLAAIVVAGATVDGARREEFLGVSVMMSQVSDVVWANYSGAPVVALPVARSAQTGLPFGIQLGGRAGNDEELVALGIAVQEAFPAWKDVPPLTPARRDLPRVGEVAPGPGPDPTNLGGRCLSSRSSRPRRVPSSVRCGHGRALWAV